MNCISTTGECTKCKESYYPDGKECKYCPVGEYSDNNDNGYCKQCGLGTYNDEIIQTEYKQFEHCTEKINEISGELHIDNLIESVRI